MVEDIAPARDEFVAEKPEPETTQPELNPDGSVKRKRGRPPGSKNKSAGTIGTRGGSLETQIGALLWTVNIPLQLIPQLQRDALDQIEITALAKAIDAECKKSATFRKYVESALKVQGATSLVSVIALIAARRVVRHEIIDIPAEMGGSAGVDLTLGALISTVSGQGIINPNLQAMKQEAVSNNGTS